jgi:hypothetical protein
VRIRRAVAAALVAVCVFGASARAATPELPTTTRPADRREVAAGQRSCAEGFQDGRFYANGWHIGEMRGRRRGRGRAAHADDHHRVAVTS